MMLICGVQDMDLLDPNRSLIHAGKVIRQPDNTIPSLEWSGWSELFVVLFDNYREQVERRYPTNLTDL
jgi:hypothetical protein